MENATKINIEVAYANSQQQIIIPLQMTAHSTVAQAIAQSQILQQFPEIDLAKNKIGIFSKATTLDTQLHAGDRVEIYHPLLIDPKTIRKQRASKQATLSQ